MSHSETITLEEMSTITRKSVATLKTMQYRYPDKFPRLVKTTRTKSSKGRLHHYDRADFFRRMVNKTTNQIDKAIAIKFITKQSSDSSTLQFIIQQQPRARLAMTD